MSIYRTIKKIMLCELCHGSGHLENYPDKPCLKCGGQGRYSTRVRASQASVAAAEKNQKGLSPRERQNRTGFEVEENQGIKADSSVGEGYLDEDEQ